MSIELITKNIWKEITKAAKLSKSKSIVAVAYFGKNGAKMLPLKKGSTLLVDASEKAVKTGQTCPKELLKLYNNGVHIYSLPNLHAKIYIIGKFVFIGSPNVSGNSSNILKEAIIKKNDKTSMKDAKEFIYSYCQIEMGDAQLKRLDNIYKPPVIPGGTRGTTPSKNNYPVLYVYNLETTQLDDEELLQLKKGKKEAAKHRINKSRHIVDEFFWEGNFISKKGDTVIQIIDEGKDTYVSPPGTLIYIKNWSNGSKIKKFCYVEIPKKNRKKLGAVKQLLNKEEFNSFKRNGKKKVLLANKLKDMW